MQLPTERESCARRSEAGIAAKGRISQSLWDSLCTLGAHVSDMSGTFRETENHPTARRDDQQSDDRPTVQPRPTGRVPRKPSLQVRTGLCCLGLSAATKINLSARDTEAQSAGNVEKSRGRPRPGKISCDNPRIYRGFQHTIQSAPELGTGWWRTQSRQTGLRRETGIAPNEKHVVYSDNHLSVLLNMCLAIELLKLLALFLRGMSRKWSGGSFPQKSHGVMAHFLDFNFGDHIRAARRSTRLGMISEGQS